ncbi:MAG: hypothetical protein AAGI44_19525 [Pseudomonadota bacterium]
MNIRLIAIVVLAAVAALTAAKVSEMRRSSELQPAKDAVLAMTVDLARAPITVQASMIPAPATPPNIVLIVADDLGWRDVGYNHSEIKTPTLDPLLGEASDSIDSTFSQAARRLAQP